MTIKTEKHRKQITKKSRRAINQNIQKGEKEIFTGDKSNKYVLTHHADKELEPILVL